MRRFAIAAITFALLPGAFAARPQATELVMFEEDWCMWCERWNDEVGVIYGKTAEGRAAPLRRLDIHAGLPRDLDLASYPQYTPTFILIDRGREVGRIEGYPGEEFFWGLLHRLLGKLPAPAGHDAAAPGPAS